MPRAATTTDAFNAIAEPRRRQIIEFLAAGQPQAVGDIVDRLNLPQPAVSKHLGVLRKVGLVSVRREGKHRIYELNARPLKAVHDWVKDYEQFWTYQLNRIKERAERNARQRARSADSENNA